MTQFASTLYPQTNPSNPILLDIRETPRHGSAWPMLLATLIYVVDADGYYVTRDLFCVTDAAQIDHARRVVRRMVAFSG